MSSQCESEVMSPFELRSELLLHVAEIDEQHRVLLARARALRDSIDAAKPLQELEAMLSALIDFTEMHFHTEEDLMVAHGYEGYGAHKAAHTELLDQAYVVRRELSIGAIGPCHVLSLFIQDWTTEHILGLDKQLFAFLASKRPSEGLHA
ncbi:MAG: bacteriohemerythrin [Bryobacteraceae bacterium]